LKWTTHETPKILISRVAAGAAVILGPVIGLFTVNLQG
jgi:hypothetical protein